MYRLFTVIRFINRYEKDEIDALVLEFELFSRTWLYEKWYVTLIKRPLRIPLYDNTQTEWGQKFEKSRHRKIRDLIDKSLELEFIEYVPSLGRKILRTNRRGREFLTPAYFVESSIREFGFTGSIVTTALITVISTLLLT
jgi:hypothetical protein